MILYCIISYLVILGMLVEAKNHNDNFEYPWLIFILSPFMLPLFIGMKLEEKSNNNSNTK